MTPVYPPEHPLGSANAKVDWAEMHIEELIKSISDSTDPDVTVVRKGTLTGESQHPIAGSVVDDVTILCLAIPTPGAS